MGKGGKNVFAHGAWNQESSVTSKGYEEGRHIFGTGKIDMDISDEAAWQARPELERKWREQNAKELAEQQAKARADKAGVKKQVTKLDTDHTDEEAWIARKKLKERSKARKKKEAEELAAANAKFKNMVKTTKRSDEIDDNLMDEEEWQIRPDLDAQNARLKAREAADLREKNAEYYARLKAVKPAVVITSPFGQEEYAKEGWIESYKFDPTQYWMPRSRDKYVSRLNWTASAGEGLEKRPPSWLAAWDTYDWGDNAGPVEDRATLGYSFGVDKDAEVRAKLAARQKMLVDSGQVSAGFNNGLASKSGLQFSHSEMPTL